MSARALGDGKIRTLAMQINTDSPLSLMLLHGASDTPETRAFTPHAITELLAATARRLSVDRRNTTQLHV
jgi:hypothetical protein